jgi:hypothetical protein
MPPPPSSPPQASTSEPVLGVVLLRRQKSLGRQDSYAGVVTSQRFIFAQVTNEMMQQAVRDAQEQAKTEGKGFWGQWANQMKTQSLLLQKYLSMAPPAIMSETPGNFAINNDNIREIKLNNKDISHERDFSQTEFEIEIASIAGKYEFRMDEKNEYVNFLKQVYCERFKTPFGIGH